MPGQKFNLQYNMIGIENNNFMNVDVMRKIISD